MMLVKSTSIAFEFPVHTIMADGQRWTCRQLNDLTRGVSVQMKRNRYLGMKITDASGRRWIVRSFRKNGRMERRTILGIIFLPSPDWRLEYELEELAPVSPPKRRSSGKSRTQSSAQNPKPTGRDGLAGAAVIKASEVDFHFPLVGFGSKQGLLCYSDLNALTHASWIYVREKTLIDMELVDNRLRRWIVRSVDPKTPPRLERWWHFGPDNSAVAFDLSLEEIEPTTLEDVKGRLLKEWELEDPEDEEAVRLAPDLGAMFTAAYQQGTGLL